MDSEDLYFASFYPEYYKVYSCDEEVSIKFENNFEHYIEKYSERKYDKIYTIDSISKIIPEHIERRAIIGGFIVIDNLNCTGHWVAFRGSRRQLEVFDSMGRHTTHKDQITFILKKKFPEIHDVTFQLQHNGPQPRGGIIPDEDRIMKWAMENNKPLPPWEHSIIMGYHSQHQFCYLESYLWLIDKQRRSYTDSPRENLEWIKSQARFLDPPPGFFYIYDPDKNTRREISPF